MINAIAYHAHNCVQVQIIQSPCRCTFISESILFVIKVHTHDEYITSPFPHMRINVDETITRSIPEIESTNDKMRTHKLNAYLTVPKAE